MVYRGIKVRESSVRGGTLVFYCSVVGVFFKREMFVWVFVVCFLKLVVLKL